MTWSKSSPETASGPEAVLGRGDRAPGVWVALIVAFIFLDVVGRDFAWHFPKIISTLLFGAWLLYPSKKWSAQVICFVFILLLLFIDIPFAKNAYTAFWKSYGMLILLMGVCIPLVHFADSLQRFATIFNAILFFYLWIGVYSLFHAGFGPGSQDENEVAQILSMALPMCYFLFLPSKALVKKLYLVTGMAVCIIGVIVGLSRGGFVALVSVFIYSLWQSPKRWLGLVLGGLSVVAMLVIAEGSYWEEMGTITDTSKGTADFRIELWSLAVAMFLDHPLTGVGAGNFIWQVGDYQTVEQFIKYQRNLTHNAMTHSVFFEVLAEWGLIGIVLWGAILYRNFRDLRFVILRSQELIEQLTTAAPPANQSGEYLSRVESLFKTRSFCHAIIGSFIGFFAAGAFLSGMYYSHFWLLTVLTIALKDIFLREVDPIAAKQVGFGVRLPFEPKASHGQPA